MTGAKDESDSCVPDETDYSAAVPSASTSRLTYLDDSANGSKGGAYRSKHRKQYWQREPNQSDRDDDGTDDSSDLDVLGVVFCELVGIGGDADEETDDGCMSGCSM